ncbi:Catechol O-methyltransferase [Durusdinium trenchii]|uniref:catechol O-methyltransferase n=1 Tax=Durusdinium trenchii TaxID=1381693 RepID=A0ABP0M0R6_9DINO
MNPYPEQQNLFAEQRGLFGGYDALQAFSKGVWLPLPKRKMNFVPLVVCSLVPWALFVLVYSLCSFQIHYSQPILCNISVFVLLAMLLIVCVKAVTSRIRIFTGIAPEREPSWWIFFAFSLLLAWFMGYRQGNQNFALASKYYDLGNLNNYTMVYPNRMLGQQLLDAGIVQFAPGSQLDIQKSMGFKNGQLYCVAPIVFGTSTPVSYDFWAVGTDCCSGNKADFSCRNYNNPQASGGIRLMDSGDRAYYRLAVQQAEATYNIKATHPLFFTWEVEPSKKVLSWLLEGHQTFAAWMVSYLVFQLFLVAVAAVVFSKIGPLVRARCGRPDGISWAATGAVMAYLNGGDQDGAREMLRQMVRTKLFNQVTGSLAARMGIRNLEAVLVRGLESSSSCYAVVNPPDDAEQFSVQEGTLLVPLEVYELLGGGQASIEMVELEEAKMVKLGGVRDEEMLQQLQVFFGTLAAQAPDAATLQDVAEEEDLDLDDEVLDYWQGYVQKSRCAMKPIWKGLTFQSSASDAEAIRPVFRPGEDGLHVVSIHGAEGRVLSCAVVGPETRLEMDQLTCAAPAELEPAEILDITIRRRPNCQSRYEDFHYKEASVLETVVREARAGDVTSVHAAIENVGLKEVWLKIAGGEKACVIDNVIAKQRPKLILEFGTYVGYTSTRMALQVDAWGGKVVTMEMDPVNVTSLKEVEARNHIEMAGLSHAVMVQLGHSDDAVQMVLEKFGAHSVDMVFMDQRGTAFHDDLKTLERLNLMAENAVVIADNVLKPGAPYHVWRISTLPHYATDIIDLREFGSAPVEDWMTVSWVRFGPSYGQLPQEVRQLNELARESDRFRLKAMATSMKDLVGDPLDDFAKKFTDEFIQLGIRTSMYVRTDIIDGCAVSRLVRLGAGESPPVWAGEDPRDEIQGGQWRGVVGGVQFAGEALAPGGGYMREPPSRMTIAPGG